MAFEIPEKGAGRLVPVETKLHTTRGDGYSITWTEGGGPMFAFVGEDDGGRDDSKPIGGFLAPRGQVFKIGGDPFS